ncbi:MAG: dTDP-4-dehydrorhamnose reductase [Phycisphaerales bacterium JB064]
MSELAGKTVHVLGGTGMLGRALLAELTSRGVPYTALSRDDIDLSKPNTIASMQPCDVLFNCAAWTDVDGAEKHEDLATQINGHAIGQILSTGKAGLLVTFGTDYVFDGAGTKPYTVSHARSPVNAYGRSKAVGEQAMEAAEQHRWLHVRTSWLYAPWGKNFVLTMRKLLQERDSLRVVNDQRGRPTSAEHLARLTLGLIDHRARGHWHGTDGGACTWYDFTCEIKRLIDARSEVEPCASVEYARPAKRPAYSVLDINETEAELGPMPQWKDNLADVLRRVPEGITNA